MGRRRLRFIIRRLTGIRRHMATIFLIRTTRLRLGTIRHHRNFDLNRLLKFSIRISTKTRQNSSLHRRVRMNIDLRRRNFQRATSRRPLTR